MPRLARRLLLAVAAAGLTLLAAEAGLRASDRAGLLARWNPARSPTQADDHPGFAPSPASDPVGQLYVAHPDPDVGLTFRPDSELLLHGIRFRTDALGLRAPPDPAPSDTDDAFRVVVLGDSVAFGFGMPDEQTLAAWLATRLAGPGGRPVVARSVAIPGWNLRNSTRMLDTHWDLLAADLVVLLPVANDLNNSYTMDALGRRVIAHDPATRHPGLRASVDVPSSLALHALAAVPMGDTRLQLRTEVGPLALEADLSPESSLRYDEAADTISSLSDTLRERGSQLVVLLVMTQPFDRLLLDRLVRLQPELPILPLLTSYGQAFRLPDDPHPNATTLGVIAGWVTEELLRLQLLPPDVRPGAIPPTPALYAAARAPALDRRSAGNLARATRRAALSSLQPVLDPQRGTGTQQVFGGLHSGGLLERRALVLLARGDGRLRVRLAALEDHPELLPQRVTVDVDGTRLGELLLSDLTHTRAVFPLPEGSGPIEVGLSAERGTPAEAGSRQIDAACRLLRLATVD